MKKTASLIIASIFLSTSIYCQIMVSKLVGKNSSNSQIGFGVYGFVEIPLKKAGNRMLKIEPIDFVYYPVEDDKLFTIDAYYTAKIGYKYVFSDNKYGFYVEPLAGVGWVFVTDINNGRKKNSNGFGPAFAFESGYGFHVGKASNNINFGLRYSSVLGGDNYTANSLSFLVVLNLRLPSKIKL